MSSRLPHQRARDFTREDDEWELHPHDILSSQRISVVHMHALISGLCGLAARGPVGLIAHAVHLPCTARSRAEPGYFSEPVKKVVNFERSTNGKDLVD